MNPEDLPYATYLDESGTRRVAPETYDLHLAKEAWTSSETLRDADWTSLQKMAQENPEEGLTANKRIGNRVPDYFTFNQRLATRGRSAKKVSFYEFDRRFEEFLQVPGIRRRYEDTRRKHPNEAKRRKDAYNSDVCAINILKPVVCMALLHRFGARHVLNPCVGWGGSMVAAAALDVASFVGFDTNVALREPYREMQEYLEERCGTKFQLSIGQDAVTADYAQLQYDCVIVSPPYYNTELYEHQAVRMTDTEWDEEFYKPLFARLFEHLQPGGHLIVNVCKKVFDRALRDLLGPVTHTLNLPKAQRANQSYAENIYVWQKNA